MKNTNPSAGQPKTTGKKRRFLSAEKKFQIYLEAQATDKPIGELLRREGLYSTDLARIRQQVKEGAIHRLGGKPGKKAGNVDTSAYDALKRELQDKERAMADQAVELAILRKKNDWGLVGPITRHWIKEPIKLAIKPQESGVVLAAHHPCEMVCAERWVGVIEVNPRVCSRAHRRIAGIGANKKAKLAVTTTKTRQIETPPVLCLRLRRIRNTKEETNSDEETNQNQDTETSNASDNDGDAFHLGQQC